MAPDDSARRLVRGRLSPVMAVSSRRRRHPAKPSARVRILLTR